MFEECLEIIPYRKDGVGAYAFEGMFGIKI